MNIKILIIILTTAILTPLMAGADYYYVLELSAFKNGSINLTNISIEEGFPQNYYLQAYKNFHTLRVSTKTTSSPIHNYKFNIPEFQAHSHQFNEDGSLNRTQVMQFEKVDLILTLPIYREGFAGIYDQNDKLILPLNLTSMYSLYESELKRIELERKAKETSAKPAPIAKAAEKVELKETGLGESAASFAKEYVWIIVAIITTLVLALVAWLLLPRVLKKT